ncbi:MAG: hypothetical protein RL514_3494 [Verrucomicrobiota bacterium]|jgi:hypothetical protein
MLERPAQLAVRIADRLRVAALMKRLDESPVPVPVRDEVKKSLALAEAAKKDFAFAIAHAATVELNTRSIGGAQHSHWLDVAMTGAELVNSHLQTVEKIDELILACAAEKRAEAGSQKPEGAEPSPRHA